MRARVTWSCACTHLRWAWLCSASSPGLLTSSKLLPPLITVIIIVFFMRRTFDLQKCPSVLH